MKTLSILSDKTGNRCTVFQLGLLHGYQPEFPAESSSSALLHDGGTAVLYKLLAVPLLFLPPAIFLGFRGQALASLLAMYASPAAVSGYIMAQNESKLNKGTIMAMSMVMVAILSPL